MAKKLEPATPISWDVYKIAKKAMRLGTAGAPDKQATGEMAAVDSKVLARS